MKFVIKKDTFFKVVEKINRLVPTRPKLPILSNLLLETKDNSLILEATDLEIGGQIKLPAKVEQDGRVLIDGRFLNDALRDFSAETVELKLEGKKLKIIGDGTQMLINAATDDEYPVLRWGDGSDEMTEVEVQEIKEILEKVAFSVSQDEIRPILTGVYFGDDGEIVTTDGVRLSIYKKPNWPIKNKKVLPLRFLKEIVDVDSQKVKVWQNDKQKKVLARTIFDERIEWSLQSQMIEGDYPNYKVIIPKDFETKLAINKTILDQQLRMVLVVARNNSNIIQMKIEKNSISLMAESTSYGSVTTKIEAEVDGKVEKKIALNGKYLQEAIRVIDDEYVGIKLNQPTTPLMICGVEKDDYLHILMPINLQE